LFHVVALQEVTSLLDQVAKTRPEGEVGVLEYQLVDPTPVLEGQQVVTRPYLDLAEKVKVLLQLLFHLGIILLEVDELFLLALITASGLLLFGHP